MIEARLLIKSRRSSRNDLFALVVAGTRRLDVMSSSRVWVRRSQGKASRRHSMLIHSLFITKIHYYSEHCETGWPDSLKALGLTGSFYVSHDNYLDRSPSALDSSDGLHIRWNTRSSKRDRCCNAHGYASCRVPHYEADYSTLSLGEQSAPDRSICATVVQSSLPLGDASHLSRSAHR